MKKITLCFFAIFFTLIAAAQQEDIQIKHAALSDRMPVIFGFGPRVGLNVAMITGRKDIVPTYGIVAGGTIDAQTSRWFSTSLDILYSSQGYVVKGEPQKETFSYVILPVMANFITRKVTFKVGLQPSILVGAMLFNDGEKEFSKDRWKKFDLAIPVGLSFPLPFFQGLELDLRYNLGLMNINPKPDQYNRNSSFTLSVTQRF